ncbi:MAG: hypothetical protein ABDI20_02310 [Candidatus Bipolaricaulaceae bacterium]
MLGLPNPVLLKGLDEACLRVSGRGFGEVLSRLYLLQVGRLTLGQPRGEGRASLFFFIGLPFGLRLFVKEHKTPEKYDRARGPKSVAAVGALYVDRNLF